MLDLATHPGRLYVVATLLPLLAFVALLAAGTVRGAAGALQPPRRWRTVGASFAVACMVVSAALAVFGLLRFLHDAHELLPDARNAKWSERIDWVRLGPVRSAPPAAWEKHALSLPDGEQPPAPRTALALELGYRIDHLTALMFAMVTVIGTAIFLFSLGYMREETDDRVEDHQVEAVSREPESAEATAGRGHAPHALPSADSGSRLTPHHFDRRGRYGRFFLYLSLFAFSMLNLLIADNLFQVFVSWELVGVSSFFLIGFYYERRSASTAANKAFIMNRVGDAGFLVGILLAWTYLGTLNFEEMNRRVRSPDRDTHGALALAGEFVRVNADGNPDRTGARGYALPAEGGEPGTHLALFPLLWEDPTHFHGLGHARSNDHGFEVPPAADYRAYGAMPYWLFVVMGIGIFLGAVGKSAQFPLHTWLPDAMEGPTPVSALIHAATMVAAGVYLVGRAFPLFAPEVLLVVAYTGAVTLVLSATIALVMTDIKRVLAYSTGSQLGYMFLALGVGGWVAGLLHLLTHAFFKALLFLCSGSVIHGCHHEQDLRKMGGLGAKMRVTSLTMLVGVLAIAGTPFFSGWYSKDQILSSALGYGLAHKQHLFLFIAPLVVAAMTGFYMFRLWFLAFTGTPRDHASEHAHESPLIMTLPLVFLAVCSVGIAWGWPVWNAEASYLGKLLEEAEPKAAGGGFLSAKVEAHEHHLLAGGLALAAAVLGVSLAAVMYWRPKIDPATVKSAAGPVYRLLANKWYFDTIYNTLIVRPTVWVAKLSGAFDKRPTEGKQAETRRFDVFTLDGLLNAVGQAAEAAGGAVRGVQTGRLRSYVLALGLTAVVLLGILTYLSN